MIKRDGKLRFFLCTSIVLLLAVIIFSITLVIKYKKSYAGKNTSTLEVSDVKKVENSGTLFGNEEAADKTKVKDDGILAKNNKKTKKVKSKNKERFSKVKFLDAYKAWHEALIDNSLKMHNYDLSKFIRKGNLMSYEDENYTSRVGIDVSHHQFVKDWSRVKAEGVDFAFIRIGARGYGDAGGFIKDKQFEYNLINAKKAGIDVGVYFYSQALNEKEALEEAEYVLNNLKGRKLDLPVIYDPEHVYDKDNVTLIGRNSKVTKEQFTKNSVTFLKKIEEAGYRGGIYANMLWQTGEYDLSKLQNYPMWFADYEKKPQSPYDFEYWQYTSTGKLKAIEGSTVDMNIQLIKK